MLQEYLLQLDKSDDVRKQISKDFNLSQIMEQTRTCMIKKMMEVKPEFSDEESKVGEGDFTKSIREFISEENNNSMMIKEEDGESAFSLL